MKWSDVKDAIRSRLALFFIRLARRMTVIGDVDDQLAEAEEREASFLRSI